MSKATITMKMTTDWRDALGELAEQLGMPSRAVLSEGVRLLAELHGVEMPPRTEKPSLNYEKQSLDFSALDWSRIKK